MDLEETFKDFDTEKYNNKLLEMKNKNMIKDEDYKHMLLTNEAIKNHMKTLISYERLIRQTDSESKLKAKEKRQINKDIKHLRDFFSSIKMINEFSFSQDVTKTI